MVWRSPVFGSVKVGGSAVHGLLAGLDGGQRLAPASMLHARTHPHTPAHTRTPTANAAHPLPSCLCRPIPPKRTIQNPGTSGRGVHVGSGAGGGGERNVDSENSCSGDRLVASLPRHHASRLVVRSHRVPSAGKQQPLATTTSTPHAPHNPNLVETSERDGDGAGRGLLGCDRWSGLRLSALAVQVQIDEGGWSEPV